MTDINSMHEHHSNNDNRSKRKISKQSGKKKRGLFNGEPVHPGYAIRYHFGSEQEAHSSVRWTLRKFHEEKNRDRKELIKHMTVFSANKAEAMSESRHLSEGERRKYREIYHIYKEAYQKMDVPEREHHYHHETYERHRKSGFPKNPHKGEHHSIIRDVKGRRRKLTFEATGHKGNFHGVPKWVMVSNEEA